MPALTHSVNASDLVSDAVSDSHLSYCNRVGFRLLKSVELRIGGQQIDRHTSLWMHLWSELSTRTDKKGNGGLNDLVGPNGTTQDNHTHTGESAHNNATTAAANVAGTVNQLGVQADGSSCASQSGTEGSDNKTGAVDGTKGLDLWVPLQFSFCRNPGLALPLIALQYHEVNVKLITRGMNGLVNGTPGMVTNPSSPTCNLYCDYIYLDTDERRRFAQVSHEYLIEQVQKVTKTTASTSSQSAVNLIFNHPVKELIWTAQSPMLAVESVPPHGVADPTLSVVNIGSWHNDYFNYGCYGAAGVNEYIGGCESNEAFSFMRLELNGHDRFSKRKATYFRTCQPQQHGHKVPSKHIYCYSFALKPEEHQPSGTCNFSRIDNAQMLFDTVPASTAITVWAINYNVLRIMSGMGGLAYSN
jgi:hypothetical protein